jgi:acyl CoA:acetate/3-ketoacid CoA transferase beta subunit
MGMGPYPKEGDEDADFINAGKETITLLKVKIYFTIKIREQVYFLVVRALQ